MRNRESNATVAAGYVFIVLLIVLAVAVFFAGRALVGLVPDDTFSDDCRAQHGHVYTMDADHHVCLRNGKVISR
jgi:hypothetical protein